MKKLEEMIHDIKSLRGAMVEIFGQQHKLNDTVGKYVVDTADILEALESYESDYEVEEYNEEEDEYEEKEAETVDEYLDYIEGIYGLEEVKADNTFNYNCNVSNDIDWRIYKGGNNIFYVVLKAHKYGDIRGNYTDECILEFTREETFLETIYDTMKYETIEIDGTEYGLRIDPLSDGIEVENTETHEEIGTIYGIVTDEDAIMAITDFLKEE